MIVINAEVPILADKRERAIELFSDLAETTLEEEDGVLGYKVGSDIDDPNRLRVFEWYEDEAAFTRHIEAQHTANIREELPDILDGEQEVTRFEVDSFSELEP